MTILYRATRDVDLDQLTTLFNSVGWERRTSDRDRLAQLVRGSTYVVSGRDGDRLVDIARAISNGAFNAYNPFYLHLDLGFAPFENVLARRRKF